MLKHMRELQKKFLATPDHTEEVDKEHFVAGFALGWEIRKELQDAGVLSTHDGDNSGTVMSEGK